MSNRQKALQKARTVPRTGGRGIKDPTKPRDKTVRITSELYEEMMAYIRIKKGHYNADFYDVCSEAWKCLKEREERHG